MGGQIKVHAVKDKGSKFWFVLPITPVRSACNEVINVTGDASQMLVENVFKNSKATENGSGGAGGQNLNIGDNSCQNK